MTDAVHPPARLGKTPLAVAAIAITVGVLAASCVWQSDGPFVRGEDSPLRWPLLSYWRNIPTIFTGDFAAFTDGQYRPVSYALLAFVRTFVSADRAHFWCLWLLGFHALNGVLLFAVARRLTGHSLPSAVAAAVFVLHPLASPMTTRMEYFPYAAGMTCFLGAMVLYLRAVQRGLGIGWLLGAILLAAGVLTCKVVAVLPVLLLAYEWVRRGAPRRALARLAPYIVAVAATAPLLWLRTPPPLFYNYPAAPAGTWWRSLASVLGAWSYYAQGLLWGGKIPTVLNEVVPRRDDWRSAAVLVPAAAALAVAIGAGLALLRARRTRADGEPNAATTAGLALVWCLATFAPFLSLAWNAVENYVDWVYLYFPTAGLALLAAALVAWARPGLWRGAAVGAGLLWCAVLAVGLVRLNAAACTERGYWEHLCAVRPGSEAAAVGLGKLDLREGRVSAALACFFDPDVAVSPRSSLLLARYYAQQGQLLAAAIHCRSAKVERAGARDQTVKPLTAKLLRQAGALDLAESTLGEVLLANPYNTEALAAQAEIWLLKGYIAAARRLVHRGRRIDPRDPKLADLERRLQNPPSHAQTVTVARPEWIRYLIGDEANESMHERIVDLSGRMSEDPVILLSAGVSLVAHGRAHEAILKLLAAKDRLPRSAMLWATLAFAYVKTGAYPEASAAAELAMRHGQSNANALCVLGAARVNQGRLKEAVRCLRAAVRLNPRYASAHDALAAAYERAGDFQNALPHRRIATQLRPGEAEPYVALGRTQLKAGDVDGAYASLSTALRMAPASAQAHLGMGEVLARMGRRQEAIAAVREAERLSPGCGRRAPSLLKALNVRSSSTWEAGAGL